MKGIEVGIGNLINLKLAPGESVEVAEELLGELLRLGHFDVADEAHVQADLGGEEEE